MKLPRPLTQAEKEAIYVALGVRRNVIETGEYGLSAESAKKSGQSSKINALSTDQMRLILLSEELVTAVLQDRVFIIDKEGGI